MDEGDCLRKMKRPVLYNVAPNEDILGQWFPNFADYFAWWSPDEDMLW